MYLAKLAVVAVIAYYASKLTGGAVHYFVMCLIMGAVFFALGFLDKSILGKTQASSLITFFVTILIFSNLAQTTPEQVLSVARRVLPAERGTVIDRDYGAEEPTDAAAPYAEKRMEVSMPTFLLGFKCPPQHGGEAQHRFAAIGELACDVLMGESSPLYARLYSQGLINGSFGAAFDLLPGAAYAYAGGDSKDPKAVAEAILDEAQRLAAEGVDGDYYKRIVNANFGAALKALNSFESIAVSMAEGRFQGYDPYRFPEIYDDITAEDVRAFLRENFTRAHMALSVIAPKEG